MRRLRGILPAGLLAMLGVTAEAQAADTVYMKISGVTGEVVTKGHEGAIAVDAFGWEYGRGAATRTRAAGPRFAPLVVTKHVDKTSPTFFDAFNTRTPFSTLGLSIWRYNASLGTDQRVQRYCFGNVTVDGAAVTHQDGGTASERVTFRYGSVSDIADPSGVFAGWDLVGANTIGFANCPT